MFDLFKVILLLLFFNTEASVLRNNVKRQTPDLHYNMTEREYKMYFGEDTQSQNPEYHVSYLMNVNERGEATSDRRMKRSAEDHLQIYYNISLFGRDFYLNLTLNKQLLAPNFHIETKHENGTNFKSATTHRKFYHGYVVSHPNSIVSLSGDDSLSGTVGVTDDEVYMIHPLPAHLSKKYVNSKEKRPHLVVKRNILNNVNSTYIDDNEDSNKDFIDAENNSDSNQLNKRQTNEQTSKILEVTYVADHLSIEHFGMIELPEMLMSIGNIVSRLFYDRSFGKRKVTYVIKRILLIHYKLLAYAANATAELKLSKITEWAHKNNIFDETDPNHADQTVLFTIGNIGGLASLGTLCRRIDASGVVSLNGLSSAFVTAHESFHNFGYVHDGASVNANCPNGAAVMSPILPAGNAAFVWSECSRNFSQKYLSSDRSRCLDNKPISKGPTQSPLLRAKLPGEIFDANKQCEMIFGVGRVQCWSKKTDCSTLYCSKDASSCSYILAPPADGTRCGDRHWCIKGKCVDDGSPIVNGNWGEWSEYSSCTLTCGIGVQHRTRKCDNPSPKNGGKTCVGPNVGQYRTCNKMACAAGSMSFRKQQCIKLGRMRDYIKSSEVCNLWCMNGWYVYHHGKAKDGTRCSNDLTDNDICVDGKCQSVGCDNEYNSGKENDRCGICDGDGSTCELRVISYTKRFYKFGTKNPFSMVTLKTGSAKIVARKLAATYNYLGICNMKGEYLINLPSWSTTVYKAGTKISYSHEHNMYADKIAIPGPLTEDLTLVFVHIYEDNQGIIIRYYEPIENVIKPSEDIFFWKEYPWTACSKTCAGGIRKKKVKCLRNDDSVVGNRFCSKKPKPAEQEACNIQDCPPEWFVTAWTPCSRRCGKGTQMREIICRRQTVKSWKVVNDLECAGPPPDESLLQRYCNEIICPPEYVGLSWSQCSATCGEGNATRKLECQFIDEEGIRQSIPSEKCELEGSPKPPTVQRCNNDIPCEESIPTYNWLGCYKDKSERTMPEMLANLRPKINWHKPENTIKECAIIAHENHKSLFAIQYYGECRSYAESNAKLNYAMYGSSHDFWSGLGGAWTNCVYEFV